MFEKGLEFAKNLKAPYFEGDWITLQAKVCFSRNPSAKYVEQSK